MQELHKSYYNCNPNSRQFYLSQLEGNLYDDKNNGMKRNVIAGNIALSFASETVAFLVHLLMSVKKNVLVPTTITEIELSTRENLNFTKYIYINT